MKKWMKYVKPYWLCFLLGPLCMIVEVIGEVILPKFLSTVLDAANSGTLTVSSSILSGIGMIGVALCMMGGGVGGAYFGAKASVNFSADLRNDIFAKVQQFSFSEIDRFSTGSLVTRLTNDVAQIQNFVNMLLRMALRSPGMMIGALIMAISIKPELSGVFAVSVPLMILAVALIVAVGFPRFTRMQSQIDVLNSGVQENVTNARVVKSFVREDHEIKKFRRSNAALKKAGMAAMRVVIFMQPTTTFFMYLTTILVIWFGSKMVLGGSMDVAYLSAFLTYVTQILMSLMMVTFLLITSARALASARRIREVLDQPISLGDGEQTDETLQVREGSVEFRDVTFRYYKNSPDPVLSHISLKIPAGSTVGIIGSTGCGKTTLLSLIPRLYDTDEGSVLLDGKDVRCYSLYHLRESVGMVLQKNILFSGSIRDNLRWGNAEATDEEIQKAAQQAQADKFILQFPQGYDSSLVQGGNNASGGQKQRLCIARALLKKPKILILDDSTSAVDTATEAMIRKALKNELNHTTKIIIAQRISSVMEADLIVVMNDGKITGTGTHEELLRTNPEYREIYESQYQQKRGNDCVAVH